MKSSAPKADTPRAVPHETMRRLPRRVLAKVAPAAWILLALAGPPAARSTGPELRPHETDDLAVVSIAASQPFPTPGEDIQINVSIVNRAEQTVRSLVVELYADGVAIARQTIEVPGMSERTAGFAWSAVGPGAMILTAVLDPDRSIAEMGRSDNIATLELIAAEPPAPGADFRIVELLRVDRPGRPTAVDVVVQNRGSATAAALVRLGSERRKLGIRVSGALEPGSSEAVRFELGRHPLSEPLEAEVNPRHRLGESDPDDNRGVLALVDGVDLALEAVSTQATKIEAGIPQLATFSFRVTNLGLSDSGPFEVRVTPGRFTSQRILPEVVAVPGLASQETVYLAHTVRNPRPRFSLILEVDPNAEVEDADRTNNRFQDTIDRVSPGTHRWVSIGPRRILGRGGTDAVGRLRAIAIHPVDPSLIYVGAASTGGYRGHEGGAGIWKTVDGGSTWQPVADSFPSLAIAALAIDPTAPARVYAVTASGLMRSEDSGATWLRIGGSASPRTRRGREILVIHPDDPDLIYLTAMDGLYLSRDRGESWSRLDVVPGFPPMDLVMDPLDPDVLYVAMRVAGDGGTTGIYRSADGGDSWKRLTGCPGSALPRINAAIRLAVSGPRVFASYKCKARDSACADGADTWSWFRSSSASCSSGGSTEFGWEPGETRIDREARQLWSQIYAAPDDPRFVYATGTHFWVSDDFGDTFERATGAHADHHHFAVNPLSPEIVYTANDGGLYRSANRGRTFVMVADGIANVEFYDTADAVTDPAFLIGGTQDNGTQIYLGDSLAWKEILGGDGAHSEVDPVDRDTLYMAGQGRPIFRSLDRGETIEQIRDDNPPNACYNAHYQVHPRTPSILLQSCVQLFRGVTGSDGSVDFTEILKPETGRVLRSAVDPATDLYYAGTDVGEILAAPSGSDWTSVFSAVNRFSVFDMVFDLRDPSIFYAAFSGKSHDGRVYRFKRNSSAPSDLSAQKITSDLPLDVQVQVLEPDGHRPFTLYAGTNQGVYRGSSTDQGATWAWQPYSYGLPFAAQIMELDFHPKSGMLRAGTMGRSAYEVQTAEPTHLRVDLEVRPPGDPGRFRVLVDGITRRADVGGQASVLVRNMMGRHTVSLTGFATELPDYVVLFSGGCAADGSVEIAEGALGRCSIAALARSGKTACVANCGFRRDLCLETGLLLPRQCVQEFNQCVENCEDRPPTINTRIRVVPSSDPGRFNIEIDGSRVASNLRDGQATGPKPVGVGRHSVGQAAGSGTTLGNYARTIAGACSADGSILLAGGEQRTCTVTNRGPQLMVRATVEPAGDPGRFHLDVDGVRRRSNATNGSTTGFLSLSAGSHSVRVTPSSSTDLADYTVRFGQACSSSGQVSLIGGDKKICEARIKAKSGRAACLANCQKQRDICLTDGMFRPSECVQQLNRCKARCPR